MALIVVQPADTGFFGRLAAGGFRRLFSLCGQGLGGKLLPLLLLLLLLLLAAAGGRTVRPPQPGLGAMVLGTGLLHGL